MKGCDEPFPAMLADQRLPASCLHCLVLLQIPQPWLTFDVPPSAEVGDYGLLHVAELTQLTSLSLDSRLFTDLGMRYITSLKGLLALDLFGAKVTDKGCHEIRWARHPQVPGLQLGPAAALSVCRGPACQHLTQLYDIT